jgi:hypothetical protein
VEIKGIKTVLAVVSLLLSLSGLGCGSNATSTQSAATALGQKYKLSANDVAGWQLDPTNSSAFQVLDESTSINLVTLIDGGAGVYTDRGCKVTVAESLVGPIVDGSPQTAMLYAMDFGTSANATTMFGYQQSTYSASDSIPGFDASVAVGHAGLVSVTVYAHINEMYFELVIGGAADSTSAYQEAAQFLTVLKSKTN